MSKPDALAEAFADLPEARSLCPLGVILRDASDDARRNLEAALDAEHVATTWIATQLRAAGKRTSKDTVGPHRKRACRCYQQ